MAKQAIIEDEEALQSIEELTESIKEEQEPVSTEEPNAEEIENLFVHEPIQVEEVERPLSTVEVTPLRDFHTSVGGTWYYFTKGVKVAVPLAVRDFLLRDKQNPKIKDIW